MRRVKFLLGLLLVLLTASCTCFKPATVDYGTRRCVATRNVVDCTKSIGASLLTDLTAVVFEMIMKESTASAKNAVIDALEAEKGPAVVCAVAAVAQLLQTPATATVAAPLDLTVNNVALAHLALFHAHKIYVVPQAIGSALTARIIVP